MKKIILILIVTSAIVAGSVVVGGILASQDNNSSSQNNTGTPNGTSTAPNRQSQEFRVTDVAQHSTANDCWLIIENGVYDVTSFLSQHPGGASRITPYCGKDATEAFATQGGEGSHSSTAQSIREDYRIGDLIN